MDITKPGTRIPIRRSRAQRELHAGPWDSDEARSKTGDARGAPESGPPSGATPPRPEGQPQSAAPTPSAAPTRSAASTPSAAPTPDVDWRDVAMRLKADMENFRKRQQRWAEDEIHQEKARLLRKFLEPVDNLERALQHIDPGDPAHRGVQMAYDGMLAMLIREGVDRVFAEGTPFDPQVHEAVAAVPAPQGQREDFRVVEVLSTGYRYRDQVLRPAKVVVAKRAGAEA